MRRRHRADRRTTKHLIYVTLAKPPDSGDSQYLSVVALASKGAQGQSTPDNALKQMWKLFHVRSEDGKQLTGLRRFNLDLTKWTVSEGDSSTDGLHYWCPGWGLPAQFSGSYDDGCRNTCGVAYLLKTTNGPCRDMADLLVAMLKLEGTDAEVTAPDILDGLNVYGAKPYGDASVYFVGKWDFYKPYGSPPATSGWPYADDYSPTGPYPSFDYTGSLAQNNPTPPGYFSVRRALISYAVDHALVKVKGNGKVYDPSYGLGPYDDVSQWEKAAIVGWGIFIDATTRKPCGDHPTATCYLVAQKVK